MSKLSYQYDILNLTPANAQPVEANFTRVLDHTNQELIERDGSVAMRAQLKLVGDPVVALDAAPKQYVDQVLPVGIVMMWTVATPPANGRWLLCDGAALQAAAYPELFAVIGYAWGGSGGTFNAPQMIGRFPLGTSGTHPLGQQGGSEDSSVAAHTHSIDHAHGQGSTNAVDINHAHHIGGVTGPSDRTLWTTENGSHNHAVPVAGRGFIVDGVSGNEAELQVGGSGYSITPWTTDNGSHSHTVTDHLHSIDRGSDLMDRNTAHSHTSSVATHYGASGQTGIAPTATNMPPYLAIPFIVRCK